MDPKLLQQHYLPLALLRVGDVCGDGSLCTNAILINEILPSWDDVGAQLAGLLTAALEHR